jgi:alcohol dehydrogenase
VVKAGSNVSNVDELLEKRVLIRSCQRGSDGFNSFDTVWMASDFNGAFADFVKVRASEVFVINSNWTDVELASIPCSYATSENMLHRAKVKANDIVLITGASGGVGSATAQLAKRRGARVIGITSADKKQQLLDVGCDQVFSRGDDLLLFLGEKSVDVVIDNVAGDGFPVMLKLLRYGGRFCSSGAIAGAEVAMDFRDFYLKDISMFGVCGWMIHVCVDGCMHVYMHVDVCV